MKVAKLPTGNILEFPDETADDAIDHAVSVHMKEHIAKKNRELQSEVDAKDRHGELMNLMTQIGQVMAEIYKVMHSHASVMQESLAEQKKHHKNSKEGSEKIVKAINTPRKKKALRDDKGKLTGSEEYV